MNPRLMCLVSSTDNLSLLPALAMAGVDTFQVRDKDLERAGLIELTAHVMALVPAARVIVNDRIDVALMIGADGVHLGASDMAVADARRLADRASGRRFLMGPFLIGATCRTAADVAAAAAAGADYAGVGPVFATTSKAGLPSPLGLDGLAAAGMHSPIPALGIGGITTDNVEDVMAAGADGVAVIGGIWNAPDPVAAARALAAAVRPEQVTV
ncbi:thiamine phosphate synthase [Nocardioides cavernaquae]|uniref:Thiamine-phosphate synthase n=1 Tax=Nocardioides cavernaquae TaxID=2321396 RepID=A0A3A5H382_9ACTN|nr:thiamine phosphate synthase [Nocardioides cavernaquae]